MRNLFLAFVLCLFCGAFTQIHAADILFWNHTGLDVNGQADTLVSAQYAVYDVGRVTPPILGEERALHTADLTSNWRVDLADEIATLPQADQDEVNAAFRADDVTAMLNTLPPGTYEIWARVADDNGNWSLWVRSQVTIIIPDNVRPTPPVNVDIKRS